MPHSDLLAEMCHAGIFVHPALYEPFGLSVLEAARAGCCLALADIPSLRELWDGAAVFVDPRDQRRWTIELNRLSRDSQARDSLAALARSRSTEYRADGSAQQYWNTYETLIRSKKDVAA